MHSILLPLRSVVPHKKFVLLLILAPRNIDTLRIVQSYLGYRVFASYALNFSVFTNCPVARVIYGFPVLSAHLSHASSIQNTIHPLHRRTRRTVHHLKLGMRVDQWKDMFPVMHLPLEI